MSVEKNRNFDWASAEGRPASNEGRWFGDRPVDDPREKTGLVRSVFERVADRYDLMNDLMSWRVHRLWKDELVRLIRPTPAMTLLDVAGGTGDVAFRFLARGGGYAVICDLTESMVRRGRDRGIDRGCWADVGFAVGDAETLPVRTGSMDAYTIAFGLRNVSNIDAALAQAHRVLRPGGRFFCLEFSKVVLPVMREMYDRYSRLALPWLGRIVAGDEPAYRYLVESIRRFPDQESLAGRLTGAGFRQVRYRNLSGGIAAIHSGWRI